MALSDESPSVQTVDLDVSGIGFGQSEKLLVSQHLLTDDMLEMKFDTFDSSLPNAAEVWRGGRIEVPRTVEFRR